MKKQLLFAFAAMSLVACVQEEVVTVNQSNAIAFENAFVDNATRAAVDPSTTTASIEGFNVWGFMDQPSGVVFTGDPVTKVGGAWTYAETQYWAPNHTYYFAAVSPIDGNWELGGTANTYGPGVLSFTNEDGSEDLLYAATSVETPRELDLLKQGMEPVKFHFSHLLSKVKFTFVNGFTTSNSSVEICDVKMTAPKTGTIDLAVENWWDNDDWKVEGDLTLEFGNVARLAATKADECAKERLTFPVDKAYEYEISFTVKLYTGDQLALELPKTTKVSGVALEMGKAYNFSAEINPENLYLPSIEFDVVEVKDWVTSGEPSNDAQVREAELKAALLLGQTYTLPYDVEITSPVVVPAGMKATLNLNGHSIINTVETAEYGAGEGIVVYGELTINDEGTVQGCTRAVWARGNDGAKVTINGGTYKGCAEGYAEGGCSVIYASSGNVIDIYGGTFQALAADEASYANTTYAALNVADNNGMINVYGGTFVKQNPAAPGTEPAAWNAAHPNGFVAEGFIAVENNNEWNVIACDTEVATAVEFEAALAAKFQKITLTGDIDLTSDQTCVIGDLVLDMNGYNITSHRNHPPVSGEATAQRISTLYVDGVNVTIVGEGAIVNDAPTAAYSISLYNDATLTIAGDVTVGSYHDAFYVYTGHLIIEDGFHYATNSVAVPEECTLNYGLSDCHRSTVINCQDDNYVEGEAKVTVKGGTFVNMDPSNIHEGRLHNRSFVADGYKVVSETQADGNVWYTVMAK